MQIPKRKPGKYTHLKPDPHLTAAKYSELKDKLERLKTLSRPRAAGEVRRLAEMGDFSDNAAYSIAKGRLRGLNQRILDLEDHLKSAVIVKPDSDASIVQLGHRVTVETSGKEKSYLILGSSETDPQAGVISHHSPVGQALLGRRVSETVRVRISTDKELVLKILKIE